jgi:hypothetical protein
LFSSSAAGIFAAMDAVAEWRTAHWASTAISRERKRRGSREPYRGVRFGSAHFATGVADRRKVRIDRLL